MELIAINRDGRPERDVPGLPETATQILQAMRQHYAKFGFEPPWVGYLALEGRQCRGFGVFRGAPEKQHVEMAWYTFPEFRGRGVATALVRQLVRLARGQDARLTLLVQTPAASTAASDVLEKFGFSLIGEQPDPDEGRVWEWSLDPQVQVDPVHTTLAGALRQVNQGIAGVSQGSRQQD